MEMLDHRLHSDFVLTAGVVVSVSGENFIIHKLRIIYFTHHIRQFSVAVIFQSRNKNDLVDTAWENIEISL